MTTPIVGSPASIGAPLRVFVNGRPADSLTVLDRGLHYGDGLFETIRIANGHLCQWTRHKRRLESSLARLGLFPADLDQLGTEAAALARETTDGVLKLILTRGVGGRGYRPPLASESSRVLLLYPLPTEILANTRDGIRARFCETPASLNPALAGMKHLNRLDSVLARAEWSDPDIAEGLMLDPTGALVGGTMTNLFIWDGAVLSTPELDSCGIAGTVRSLTLELASRLGIDCREMRIGRDEVSMSHSVFVTNSVAPIWPVRELQQRPLDLATAPWELIDLVRQEALRPG